MSPLLSHPETTFCKLEFPSPSVLLVTLNQPKELNVITLRGHQELDSIWRWFDETPDLIVAILTGSGRAFSGGADLQEWEATPVGKGVTPANGFGGLSLRRGKKPVIAAVNGLSVGGATEMVINCDMVVASAHATLALPDVKVGLTGFGGTFPRLVRRIGRSRATDMCLTGRNVRADEAFKWGLVDRVVEEGKNVVEVALDLAKQIAANSPDAIIATRDGLIAGEDGIGSIEAGIAFIQKWVFLVSGENCKEGINAFNQRRKPVWKLSKL